jgi:hypothetical protein
MSSFLVNLARRGVGLPATAAAISVAPAAVFAADTLTPVAVGSDVSAYSHFVAIKDDLITRPPDASQTVANPSAPLRSDGDSIAASVESSITPEPASVRSSLEASGTEMPPAPRAALQVESVRKRTPATNFAPMISRSILSPSALSPHQEAGIAGSATRTVAGGPQDSQAKVIPFSRTDPSDFKVHETFSPSPASEPNTVPPPKHPVIRGEPKEDISAPVVVNPSASELRARFALSRSGEISKPAETMPAPIHVRIGRIEVRGTSASAAQAPRRVAPPAPLGFASYLRLRTYRNWPR